MSQAVERIAVVGLACVYPGAPDAATFWQNILSGQDAITDAPADRIDPSFFAGLVSTSRGGFVTGESLSFEPGRYGIMPLAVKGAEPDQMLALKTSAAALDDAGDLDGVDRERIGVVLGRGGYLTPGVARLEQRVRAPRQLRLTLAQLLPDVPAERLAEVEAAFEAETGELRPEAAIGLVPNLAASRVANRFDLGGPAYTVDAACASSLVAVDAAIAELGSGRCDMVLAGGLHHCHDVTLWSVFSQLGALSPSGVIRPFSRHADGVLVGEGTGILVLERLSSAEALGHRVYATILGTGVASDGRHSSLMSPRVDGQVLALERAYRAAQVDPASVGLLEGHGTATPAGDRAELETIRVVYGKHEEIDGPRPVLGSVKSNIGHAMPAAGAAGLIKAVLAVHHGVLPPTLHAEEPNPAVAETRFRLIGEPQSWTGGGTRRAGVNAFGFGGINAHVVIEQHGSRRAAPRPRADQPVFRFDAVLLQGEDAADLAAQLEAGVRLPSGAGPARLALVDPTPRRLDLALRLLAGGHPWRGRQDIWFEHAPLLAAGGKVAFLLPGIEPNNEADLSDVARWFGLDPPAMPPTARGIEMQGRRMFQAGCLLHGALGLLGVTPDLIAGHSLGEWTGAVTSELIPAERAEEFLRGLEPGGLELPDVDFLALGCGAEMAAEVVADLEGVVVSHDNCPHQSVICGPEELVEQARRRFADRKVMAQLLPFRSGFHTPWFEPYLDVVRHHWARMPMQPPRYPFWSATTCEPYPSDPGAVRELAVRHLVEPVRFRGLIERLHAEGVRAFVQLGVGSLIAFTEDTLKDRPQLGVTAAVPNRSGMAQLARAAAALWVEGAGVNLERLLEPAGRRATTTAAMTAPAAAPAQGPTVRLSLGTPLVRLPAGLRLPVAAPAGFPAEGATSPAVGAELAALLADTAAAAGEIASAMVAIPPATTAQTHARAPVRAPVRTPVRTTLEEQVEVSVSSLPWIADHCFYRQPAGWEELADRFPVVPMTTMVEMLGAAAARLVPGTRVASVENVRALRWLVAAPPATVTVTARVVGEHRVEAALEGYARATVNLAAELAPGPAPSHPPLRGRRASPVSAAELYAGHWMFHGAAFQGVRAIDALGDDGCDGSIEVLPVPGAWLDNAGQLYGWWLMATADSDFLMLPQAIERIEWFAPQPAAGAPVATTVRVREVADRTVRADLELSHGGCVAVRITGWVDRRFDSDGPLWLVLREPERNLVANPFAECGGFSAVEERWADSPSRELMARRYLGVSERTTYEALNPRRQRTWLLERIAAKDAVRDALWSEGHGPLFPVEVPLADDTSGRGAPGALVVTGGPAAGWRLVVASAPWIGVAALGGGGIEVGPGAAGTGGCLLLSEGARLLVSPGDDAPAGEMTREITGKEYRVVRHQLA